MTDLSTFEQASAAIARLDLTFGAEHVTEMERFKELRLFRQSRPDHVQAVVRRCVRYFNRRPNPDELSQLLTDERLGRRPDDQDVTPSGEVGGRVAALRQRLVSSDVQVRYRTDRVVSASVRDDTEGVVDVVYSEGMWTSGCRCRSLACHHVSAVKQTLGTVA